MKKQFSIFGMSCTACALSIEKAVSKIDGVENVSVSLMDKTLYLEVKDNLEVDDKIFFAVKKLGYGINDKAEKREIDESKILKNRFFVSLVLLVPLMYLCFGNMLKLPIFPTKINLIIEFVLAGAIMIVNGKFFVNGFKSIIHGAPNMDALVSIGSLSAYIYSIVISILIFIGNNDASHVFYESAGMVLTLVTLGKYLEERAKSKTGDAINKLNELLPDYVNKMVNGKEESVLRSTIDIGDILVIRAGEYLTVDGEVVEGEAGINDSALTGESLPKEVSIGEKVYSGSMVVSGFILVKALSVGERTLFYKIVERVKEASGSKAPIQKMVDKISAVFVPIVCLLALITFIAWIIISNDLYLAFKFGISVLVISCPCSLGLATPVAVMASTGSSAKKGILFKNAEPLTTAKNIDCVLLDKTATITEGKPRVVEFENYSGQDVREILDVIYALEEKSSHPLAECLKEYSLSSKYTCTDYEYTIGKGIKGEVNGEQYILGNASLLKEYNLNIEEESVNTLLYLAKGRILLAKIGVADSVKKSSFSAVKRLNDLGILTVMVTGDKQGVAEKVAKEVGISKVICEVLPDQKYQAVSTYQQKGKKVAFVGDGINDSPAITQADIGYCMGNGTDVSIDSADVIIASNNLTAVADSIEISKKTSKIINQNLFWAFFYNSLAIPIASGVFSFIGITLVPYVASICMSISSLIVVTNALRLTTFDKKKRKSKLIVSEVLIEGMMCNHCVQKVKTALSEINGVEEVKVSLKDKKAKVYSTKKLEKKEVIIKIENVGFKVTEEAKFVATGNEK